MNSDSMQQISMVNECPTCGKSGFENEGGMKSHHKQAHDESIAGFQYECEECGDSFIRDRRTEEERYFCSIECLTESQKKRKEIECEVCGDTFEVPNCNAEERKTCSKECWSDYISEYLTGRRQGSDHPQWVEDTVTAYQNGWEEIRDEVVDRDGNQCVLCCISNKESINRYGVGLHVHHIRPARDFDDVQDSHKKENLVTLCVSCHRSIENKSTSEQLSIFARNIDT